MVIVSLIDQSPFSFFRNIITSGQKVKEELVKLNSFDKENRWGNTRLTNNSKYDDYILVIGESARKDYHHAYGYPINNTPFMSASNGVLVDGFTSAGTNTIASLRLMLTKPNLKKWEPDYSLNLIDLVKNSGIKTYWISNQGYFGKFDTPISAIANKSDVKIFMKSGTYNSYNISDFELIPRFDKIIFGKSKTKRFIVIHLYGSHPMACDRLFDYKKIIEP
nr:phosphoethanolamine transferase [Proteus mirabilis]